MADPVLKQLAKEPNTTFKMVKRSFKRIYYDETIAQLIEHGFPMKNGSLTSLDRHSRKC